MKRFVSQAFAALLAFAMLLGLMPISALAAYPDGTRNYTKSFLNVVANRGITATINTTDAEFGAKLESAADHALIGTIAAPVDAEYQAAKALFEQNYTLSGDFELITWTLTLDGQTVTALPAGTTITYSNYEVVSGTINATVYTANSAALSAVQGAVLTDFMNLGILFQASFTVSNLNSTITIANDKLTAKDTSVTRTYSDGLDYFSVQVTASAADLPESGSVHSTTVDNHSNEWADIQALLETKYDGQLSFTVQNLALRSGMNEFTLPDDAQTVVTVRLATIAGDPYIYQYANGALEKLTTEKKDAGSPYLANFSFRTNNLSGIVLLNSSGLTEKNTSISYTRTYSDANGMFTAAITTSKAGALPETGTLSLEPDTVEAQTQDIRNLLQTKYNGALNFSVYDAALLNNENQKVVLPEDAVIVVTAKTFQTTPFVFNYANGKLTKLTITNEGSGTLYDYTFRAKSLENLVMLNSSGVTVNRFSDFAAGQYRITANLYVKGEDNEVLSGVTAYLTNPDLPPVKAMKSNAIMNVDEYGDLTITVDVQNGIFSLQHIEDGEDVHIVDSTYGADEGAPAGVWGPYEGRIMQLVVAVDHLNGEYGFTNSKQYPTILQKDVAMPIYLGVDFDSATRMMDGVGESNTFTDDATGVAVTVQTTDSQLAETLSTAKLAVTPLEQGNSYDAAKKAIVDEYVDEPDFKLYDIHLLTAEGQEIAFTWSEAVAVTLPLGDGVTNGEVSAIKNGSVNKITSVISNNSVAFEGVSSLGQFAVVNKASIPSWIHTSVVDAGTGIILNAYSIDGDTQEKTGMFAERTKSLMGLMSGKEIEGEYLATALQSLKASEDIDLLNPVVEASYQMAIVNTILLGNIELMESSLPKSGAGWQVWRGKNDAFIKALVPVSGEDNHFYLITSNGVATTATELDATMMNGMATIELVPRNMNQQDGEARIFSLYWGQRKVEATKTRPISYVVAVKNKVAEQPTAIGGLKYTGSEQTGVAEGPGFTLTGNKATGAGNYTAIATLNTDYMWSDGTTSPLQIQWSIAAQDSGGPGGVVSPPVTKTVTANLYVPGSLNTQLPGVNAYLTNGNNPQGIGGYPKKAPTEPVANNAQLTTDSSGKMTLVVDIPNPVFTLQKIDGGSNAKIIDIKRDTATYGSHIGRITQITVELLDKSGTYVFADCLEFPTLLGVNWNVPLTLSVEFSGGSSGLPSESDVDVDGVIKDPTAEEPTEETTSADGIVSTKVTNADGSSVITMETPDGSTSETSVDPDGKAASVIALSKQAAANFKAGTAFPLPIPVIAVTNRLETAPSIKLTSLGDDSVTSLLVTVPASRVTTGTVVVMVKEDGTTQVLAGTKYNDGTLVFTAERNVTYKLVDNSKSYRDVAANSWYQHAVQYMSARELMSGTDNGFSPSDSTSRAMIVTILYRLAGLPAISGGAPAFADVTPGKYYANAVAWASAQGLANGYGSGTFGVNDPVTREQLAVMLWRYAGSPASSGKVDSFADRNQVSGYAAKAMAWAVEKGIMAGKGNGILDPKGQATRAQTAQMLMNFLETLPAKE